MVFCSSVKTLRTYFVFCPRPIRPTNKGRYRACTLSVINGGQLVSHSAKAKNTDHLRGDILACPSYRRPRKLPSCSRSRWPSAPTPQESAGSRSKNRPSCAHTSHVENHLVRFAVSPQFLPPFARFIMSFVSSCFRPD